MHLLLVAFLLIYSQHAEDVVASLCMLVEIYSHIDRFLIFSPGSESGHEESHLAWQAEECARLPIRQQFHAGSISEHILLDFESL